MGSQINTNARKTNFESAAFRNFDFEKILNNDSQDPDENFFNAFNFKDLQYFTPEKFSQNLNSFDNSSFSMLHLNIRSLQKNFDSLLNLLMTLKFEFKVICITETWCSDNSMNHNLFELPQYKSIHHVRRAGKGGGIATFFHESLTFNIRHDLSVNNADIEALCVEIINKKSKIILINTQYRQPAENFNEFEAFLTTFLANSKTTDKTCFLVGDLNLNLIDYQSNAKVRNFVNLIFQHSLVPIVNKPTRVTKNNARLIDYIITNSFTDQENLTGILKTDISDHFPIFNISTKHGLDSNYKKVTIKKRIINADLIQEPRDILSEVNWGNLHLTSNPNDAYEYFLKVFSGIYDLAFPLKTISVKKKTLQKPWMTKGLLKSSK